MNLNERFSVLDPCVIIISSSAAGYEQLIRTDTVLTCAWALILFWGVGFNQEMPLCAK